jgi:hypothetical protein
VFRAAGETETTQENIQDWLQLAEADPGFQLLVFLKFLNKGCTVIFYYVFSSVQLILLIVSFIYFLILRH